MSIAVNDIVCVEYLLCDCSSGGSSRPSTIAVPVTSTLRLPSQSSRIMYNLFSNLSITYFVQHRLTPRVSYSFTTMTGLLRSEVLIPRRPRPVETSQVMVG